MVVSFSFREFRAPELKTERLGHVLQYIYAFKKSTEKPGIYPPLQHRRAAQKSYLQTVFPRLEILFCDLSAISSDVGVIPNSLKPQFELVGVLVRSHESSDDQQDSQSYPGSLVAVPLFERLYDVWEAAMDCAARNVAEPSWNAEVHSRLLYLALCGYWKSHGVWCEDITTARISDKSLLAKVGTTPIASKLVGYAIMIDPDSEMERRSARTADAMTRTSTVSINCTNAEYIQFRPIAVSIATIRETSSNGDLYQQLGTWVSAHYLKLSQLAKTKGPLPAPPLLTVDGHRWRFMIAVWHVESDGYRLEILSSLPLGETSSLSGVYQILAAIRRLAKWADEDYRV